MSISDHIAGLNTVPTISDADKGYWLLVVAATGLAISAVIAVYWSTAVSAVTVWANSDTYQFAFLVFPVSIYIVWMRRQHLAGLRAQPMLPGLLLVVPFGLMWLVSNAAEAAVGQQLAVVGIIQTLLLTSLGWRVYQALLFPFLYLWLLVPSADFLVQPLQLVTTHLTVGALNLLGVSSHSEGILILAAGSPYRIVEQCAALDFLLGSLAFSLVYANLIYQNFTRRAVFVSVALAAAIIANLVRTTSIIFLTDVTEGRIDLASDHQLYGRMIFLLTVAVLMSLGLFFRENTDAIDAVSGSEDLYHLPVQGHPPVIAASAVVVLAASFAPAYAAYSADVEAHPTSLTFCTPRPQGPWRLAEGDGDWKAVFPSADLRFSRRYLGTDQRADLFVAYYWRQRSDAELVSWENHVADNDKWMWLSSVTREVEVEGRPIHVTESRLRAGKRRRLVWHWNWVDGRFTSSSLVAKLLQAKASLLTGDLRAAFIAVSVEETNSTDFARGVLRSLTANGLLLTPALERVGAGLGPC